MIYQNRIKKAAVLLCTLIQVFACSSLNAQNHNLKSWIYNINVQLKDSTIRVNINLKAKNINTKFFLFNRFIKIEDAKLNGKPLKYTRSNDSIYFKSPIKKDFALAMQYQIPYSMDGYSKVISSVGDSTHAYPVQFVSNQLFFERFSRWYPVLYDNFSNYTISISVPKTDMVFAYYPEIQQKITASENIYFYRCFDEDFAFFTTQSNIFLKKKVVEHNKTHFEFNFLPKNRRLLSYADKKPSYTYDSLQKDSLLNAIANRSTEAFDWYSKNLWPQQIDTLRFVETNISGLAVCMKNFIIMDRTLLNQEVIDNYAFSHEIGHIWIGQHTVYMGRGNYFLGESINEYVNLLYYESWAGKLALEDAIKSKINSQFSDKPFFEVTFDQVLNQRNDDMKFDVIYNKGTAFIHKFRKMIDKEKLLKIIRETYAIPNHLVVLHDFEKCIKANGCWNEYLKLYKMKL